jgi:hypothetical protein
VALSGTPHLWVVDARGLLHWGGDTRALQGKTVRGDLRVAVTLDQLKTLARREPWLSAGLVKLGEPIYLPKWETTQPQPTLSHIRDLQDLALFGIDARTYGAFVLERAQWEARYPFKTDSLARDVLASAAGLEATPTADGWRLLGSEADGYVAYIPANSVVDPTQFSDVNEVVDSRGGLVQALRAGRRLYLSAGWASYAAEAMERYATAIASGTLDAMDGDNTTNEYFRLLGQRYVQLGAHDGLEASYDVRPERRAEYAAYTSWPTALVMRMYIVGSRVYYTYAYYPEEESFLQDAARFLDSFGILA